MKILQITPTFVPSKFGGMKVVSYSLSKALAKKGHEVTVYTTDAEIGYSRLRNIRDLRNMHGFYVRYFKNMSNLLAFKYRLFLPMGMVSAAKKEISSFGIIHLHGFRTFQNIVMHHYAKRCGVPYVLQAHGSLPRMMAKRTLKEIYDFLWGHKLLRDSSKVIALTKMEAEQYKNMGVSENRIEIVPNGIDLSEFENLPQKGGFKRKHNLNDNQRVVLYLGRIHQIKGLDLLAKAFVALLTDFNGIKLVIAGPDDGYLTSLKKLVADLEIGDKVLFTGPLYGQEKLQAYVDADVYVLPSIYETFPITVLESCACGLPVVVTDRCGIADTINGQVGLVVPYERGQLSGAISRILNNGEVRQQFGEKGKALVREKFDWSKIVEQLEDIYQGVLTKTT